MSALPGSAVAASNQLYMKCQVLLGLVAVCIVSLFAVLPSGSVTAQTRSETSNQVFPADPLEVSVGIRIEQIVFVDQKSENFGVVAVIRLQWRDPKLAFSREEYGRDFLAYTPDEFRQKVRTTPTIAPGFVIQNQQDRRWEQQAIVVVNDDGLVDYYERSTITLQAPHFDFRRFPFDTQLFFLEITSLHPSDTVRFVPLEEESGMGDFLGEEAWIIENAELQTATVLGLSGLPSSQVALAFTGRRHIQYYVLRIFIPMLVLIAVSWATFFLDEYRRRIEISGANLLAFVVFNFAVSDKLPELGYLTFLDFILQWMFIVTGAVIVLNVGLSRMEKQGHKDMAKRVDTYVVKWIYPLSYGIIVALGAYEFLLRPFSQ